jgi:hypothetical protein
MRLRGGRDSSTVPVCTDFLRPALRQGDLWFTAVGMHCVLCSSVTTESFYRNTAQLRNVSRDCMLHLNLNTTAWTSMEKTPSRFDLCILDRRGLSRYSDSLRARRSAPVQSGPGAHPVSCTLDTECLPPGVKWPGRGVNHPPRSSSEVKERVELYLYSRSRSSWPVTGGCVPRRFE